MSSEEGRKFEEQWQDAFNDAEMEPPAHIWTGIDSALANSEAKKLNKQVRIYRYVAAAAILLSFGLVAQIYIGEFMPQNETEISTVDGAVNHPKVAEVNNFSSLTENNTANLSNAENQMVSNQREVTPVQPVTEASDFKHALANETQTQQVAANAVTPERKNSDFMTIDNQLVIDELNRKGFDGALAYNDQQVYFEKVPVYDFSIKDKRFNAADSWAGVELSGGLFEPNYSTGSNNAVREANLASEDVSNNFLQLGRADQFSAQNNNNDMTAGASYVVGVNYGTKVAKRMVLQSGLQYGRYESVSVTNTVYETSNDNAYALSDQTLRSQEVSKAVEEGEGQLRYENVELNNRFNFASLPVQAGYVLLDKKLNLMVTGGISTSIFLSNQIIDPDEQFETVQFKPGGDSPYRTFSFSALTGLAIGYSFLENYSITINPTYQRAINSLTRDASGFSANPEGFGLAVGVRYTIK